MFRTTSLLLVCALIVHFLLPTHSYAQEVTEDTPTEETPAIVADLSSPISFSFSPENPAPKTKTTITLVSFGVTLNSATIAWSIDGKTVLTGIGAKTYTLTTKQSGSATKIKVTVTPATGDPITTETSIIPGGVDILWQATDSIVPPLYRGKALPTTESAIRYVAMTDIRESSGKIAPASLVYTWKHNGALNQKASGYGKYSFSALGSYVATSQKIEVTVENKDRTVSAKNAITIATVLPKINWYETSSLYGPRFDAALTGTHTLSGNDISLLAMPYFFSPNNPLSPRLAYSWKINGEKTTTPSAPNLLFLRREADSAGNARIDLSIENVSTLFQEAAATLSLNLQ